MKAGLMNSSKSLLLFSILFLSVLSASLVFSERAYAEGALREKLKQRLKDRMAKKMQSKPAPETNASVGEKLTEPGDYTFSIEFDGLKRMYMVHVPKNYTRETPVPLLLAFHGGGGDMKIQATDKYYGHNKKADQEGYVVVFPNGYSKFNSGILATWNAGTCCGKARDEKIDDVGFVRQIIKNLSSQLNIDKNKIFATGMSNGGMLSHRLACEMADTFKAIASVAGTDGTLECTPSRPISVMHIHAKDDDHVLFNGGAGKSAFKDISTVTEFVSVPETIDRWIKRDQCNPTPKRVLENPGAHCDLYSQCKDNVQVELCVTETGGHSWPGGTKPRGGGESSKAINADDVMWDFFMSQK